MLSTIYLAGYLFLFHIFWGDFLSIKTNFSVILFCLTFTVSMKLGERVVYPGPEGLFLCGSVPMQLTCAQWFWWKKWIWSEHRSYLPPECAGSYHLGESWSWLWRSWSQSQVWAGLLLWSVPAISGWVGSQGVIIRALRLGSKPVPFLLSVCSPSFQLWYLCSRGEQSEGRGPGAGDWCVRGMCWGCPGSPVRAEDSSQSASSWSTSNSCPYPIQIQCKVLESSSPLTLHSPWQEQPSP